MSCCLECIDLIVCSIEVVSIKDVSEKTRQAKLGTLAQRTAPGKAKRGTLAKRTAPGKGTRLKNGLYDLLVVTKSHGNLPLTKNG